MRNETQLAKHRKEENKRYWDNHEEMKKRLRESYHRNDGKRKRIIREELLRDTPLKVCDICGKKYNINTITKLKNQRYCSEDCYLKAKNTFIHKNQISKLKRNRLCVNCGKTTIGKKYGAEHLCNKCNMKTVKAGRIRMDVKEHRFEIINCVLCGEDITGRHSMAKYCIHCVEEISRIRSNKHINTSQAISLWKTKKHSPLACPTEKIGKEKLYIPQDCSGVENVSAKAESVNVTPPADLCSENASKTKVKK